MPQTYRRCASYSAAKRRAAILRRARYGAARGEGSAKRQRRACARYVWRAPLALRARARREKQNAQTQHGARTLKSACAYAGGAVRRRIRHARQRRACVMPKKVHGKIRKTVTRQQRQRRAYAAQNGSKNARASTRSARGNVAARKRNAMRAGKSQS